jgi:hypothetical protein
MKTAVKCILVAGVLMCCVGGLLWARRIIVTTVAHQRPYKWDQFAIPRIQFTQEPLSNVFNKVNEAVKQASHGAVQQVVIFDTSPVQITKFAPSKEIEEQMDDMISAFRAHEKEMASKGKDLYENGTYSGLMGGGHSLGCTLQELALGSELGYEERADGVHIWHDPRVFECRAYRISEGLTALMEAKRRANDLHVDAEPIVSAFAQATSIHSWSFWVPDGPNRLSGEFRFNKVFRHLKDSGLILALATPEEHKEAESKLKSAGLWVDVPAEKK